MKKKTISVCLAVYNEEKRVKACLESVIDWVDEIVIIDGYSTDKTVEIAKKFGKKVVVHFTSNKKMFHENKQIALSKAKMDWVLQLDADEKVTTQLRDEILKLANNENSKKAYWMPRLNFFLNSPLTKGGQYPDYTIRFYKNGSMFFPCKSVHEQVEFVDAKDYQNIGYLQNPLWHYPYATFADYLSKWERYSDLEADIMIKKGLKPNLLMLVDFFVIKPKMWFLKSYLRHRGYVDGFAGFVFAFFSGLRFPLIYTKFYEKNKRS